MKFISPMVARPDPTLQSLPQLRPSLLMHRNLVQLLKQPLRSQHSLEEVGEVGVGVVPEEIAVVTPTTTGIIKINKTKVTPTIPVKSLTRRARSTRICLPVLAGPVLSTGRRVEELPTVLTL